MLDLVVKGGTVVDGTGSASYGADVGIRGGRIVEIGSLSDPAARTIDADGALVTPGWVDIHTHYDGQVTWDDVLEPSASNGVTTLVMGNCGVGFAPVRPGDEDTLIDLMEGVEDIPGTALTAGMPWGRWETFDEYLDSLAVETVRPRHRRAGRPRSRALLRDGRARRSQRGCHRRGHRGHVFDRGSGHGRRSGRVLHLPHHRPQGPLGTPGTRHLRPSSRAVGLRPGHGRCGPRRVRGNRGRHHRLPRAPWRRASQAHRRGAASRVAGPGRRVPGHIHRGPTLRGPGPLADRAGRRLASRTGVGPDCAPRSSRGR